MHIIKLVISSEGLDALLKALKVYKELAGTIESDTADEKVKAILDIEKQLKS